MVKNSKLAIVSTSNAIYTIKSIGIGYALRVADDTDDLAFWCYPSFLECMLAIASMDGYAFPEDIGVTTVDARTNILL